MTDELSSMQPDQAGRPPTGALWPLAGSLVALLFVLNPGYLSHLLVMVEIYLLLAYSLNFITGFGGVIVFCHAAFYGIGAYVYALVRLRAGEPGMQVSELLWAGNLEFLPGVILAGMAGAFLAWGIGWICLRFRGDHFIFATLGFQMIVFVVLFNWVKLAGGPFGIYGIPRPTVFGLAIRESWQYSLLVGVFLTVILSGLFRLYQSPFGLGLKTMREDERAARAMGINTNALALRAIVLGGGVAGIAGALYAGYVTYIDPSSFSLRESIFLVTLLMLGGGGNIKGPVIGTVVMLALPESLRFVGLPDAVATNVREIIYGTTLASLMYWRPQGLSGTASIRS